MTPTEKALITWYKPGNPLYRNPEPAALGLAGEVGELVDLYKKHKYKPGFSWMSCKYCAHPPHIDTGDLRRSNCIPFVIDELGDIWYYLRILAWMNNVDFSEPALVPEEARALQWIKRLYWIANLLLYPSVSTRDDLDRFYYYFLALLNSLGCTIEELTELNYKKLSSSGNHGWKDAK